MKNLTVRTEKQLNEMTLAAITECSNSFAKELKVNETKRFATKAKAIAKVISLQYVYVEKLLEHDTKSTPKKIVSTNKKFELDTIFELGSVPTKEGTAMDVLVKPVKRGTATAKFIIQHFIKNFQQNRGVSEIGTQFARSYITGAMRKGYLNVKG